MNLVPLVLALGMAPAEVKVAQKELPVAVPAVAAALPVGRVRGLKEIGIPFIPPPPPGTGTGSSTTTKDDDLPLTIGSVGGPGDESILKSAKVLSSDQALVEFFRKRTPPAPDKAAIAELVKKLGAKDEPVRDAAQSDLTAIGQAAVPLLRQMANNSDEGEASTRARDALKNIEGSAASNLVINVARLLASRKPAGAAEVLINYLPYSEDDAAFGEVEAALVAVAMTKENKPDPAILKALKHKLPLLRGTAAQVLCQAGGTATHSAIRPLLKDERASVRVRAALGLVSAYDPEAIPVLIGLLGEPTPRLRLQAERFLTDLAGEWAVKGPTGDDAMSRKLRREIWAAWWKNTDGEGLLEEFKSRTASDADYEKVAGLIAKLGDADADTRDKAMKDLIDVGKAAASQLRRAVNEGHPQISPLAVRCLEALAKDAPTVLPGAAPRLLALRKPEGTVETLLAYLPFAETADLADKMIDVLSSVGVTAGKADASLVKALEDKVAFRRAGAALALCKGKATDQVAAIRKLLKDKDWIVQFKAAQGLAMMGEKESIPTLIALLKDLPLEKAWEVEDYLARVAGDLAPTEVVTADTTSRGKAVDAWTKWWKDNEKKIDLARADGGSRELGFYVIVENWNPAVGSGRVVETDRAGKLRWEIRTLQWPNDVQLLRGGNVLVIEQQNRVTERDRTGKIVGMDRYYGSVFHAERLRDGNTFLACRNQLLIVDNKFNTVLTHTYNMNSILAAKRFRDGTIAYVSYSGHYVKLDRTGKQISTTQLQWGNYSVNGAEILPGDRIVLSETRFNKVMEFDVATGKVLWETPITYPLVPTLLSNGNLMVAGNNNMALFELDRKGKIVKEWKDFSFRPLRAFRR